MTIRHPSRHSRHPPSDDTRRLAHAAPRDFRSREEQEAITCVLCAHPAPSFLPSAVPETRTSSGAIASRRGERERSPAPVHQSIHPRRVAELLTQEPHRKPEAVRTGSGEGKGGGPGRRVQGAGLGPRSDIAGMGIHTAEADRVEEMRKAWVNLADTRRLFKN